MTTNEILPRAARITPGAATLSVVEAYLPSNYSAYVAHDQAVVIHGFDVAGWTLDGYVIPRLASGLIVAREVSPETLEAGR